jgi:hypothetical protein
MGKTQSYYDKNPVAKAKKDAYNKEFNTKPEQRAKRSELVQKNRDTDKKGVDRTGKDYDHATKRLVKLSVNRGRNSKNGGTAGDKRARG